jgi:hypothetical protein
MLNNPAPPNAQLPSGLLSPVGPSMIALVRLDQFALSH